MKTKFGFFVSKVKCSILTFFHRDQLHPAIYQLLRSPLRTENVLLPLQFFGLWGQCGTYRLFHTRWTSGLLGTRCAHSSTMLPFHTLLVMGLRSPVPRKKHRRHSWAWGISMLQGSLNASFNVFLCSLCRISVLVVLMERMLALVCLFFHLIWEILASLPRRRAVGIRNEQPSLGGGGR